MALWKFKHFPLSAKYLKKLASKLDKYFGSDE